MTPTLIVAPAPTGSYWALGPLPPPTGTTALVRWQLAEEPVDAGMPAIMASILAAGMTAVGMVTFPCSDPAVATRAAGAGDTVRTLRTSGLLDRFRRRRMGLAAENALISTRTPATAAALFDDAFFSWSHGQQVALLSRDVPPVDAAALDALLEDGWATQAAALRSAGVRAAIRAGVDGDVLGLWLPAEDAAPLLDAWRRTAADAGVAVVEG